MANLFKALKPHATPSRNGFDLSQKHVFSSKAGQLIPCLSVETVPGDKFEINMSAFMRTQTMNSAAFLRGKFHYDFFFVPYIQLWHNFNLFISERDDKHSSLQKSFNYCPSIDLYNLLIFAYKCSGTISDSQANEYYYNVHGQRIGHDIVRLLDMLGYGNYLWIFECSSIDELIGLLDESAIFGKKVNILRIAAYQHIYYDWYRNKFYEISDSTGGIAVNSNGSYVKSSVNCFNFDDLDCNTPNSCLLPCLTGVASENARVAGLFTLRFAQWKKDLFTSSLPSQQFGVVSSVDLSFDSAKFVEGRNVIYSGNRYSLTVPDSGSGVASKSSGSLSSAYEGTWSIPSAFDVLQLRKAEVLQKYKQNMLRAGNMTDDNYEAHYGVKPYYDSDENVHYLGSFSSRLDVNPVESTSATGAAVNGKVGSIAANGTSLVANGDTIRFDAKDFGVIMCIANYVPDSEYNSEMMDKANSLFERFDFFTPEFENIGLEAISKHFVSMNIPAEVENAGVLGFAPRYWMYKTAVDKVHGEFSTSSLTINNQDYHGDAFNQPSLAPWVAPRKENMSYISGRPLSDLYVNPNVLDKVFGVNANTIQYTDQFLHNVFFDVKAIRPMSILGLPQF